MKKSKLLALFLATVLLMSLFNVPFAFADDHIHDITYFLENEHTILGECTVEGCFNYQQSLVLIPPGDEPVYYNCQEQAADIEQEEFFEINVREEFESTIQYYTVNGDTATPMGGAVPTNAGSYRATFTVGEGSNQVTAVVNYTIAKQPARASNIAITVNCSSVKVTNLEPYETESNNLIEEDYTVLYAINTSSTRPENGWQESAEFTNLTPNTTYWLFAKVNMLNYDVEPYGTMVATGEHALSYVDGVAATCAAKGTIAYYQCSLCNGKYTDAQGTSVVTDTTVNEVPHSYTVYVSEYTPATCTTNRKDTYKCATCTATTVKEIENSKVAHSYTEYLCEYTPATCTTNRKDAYGCANCPAETIKEIENTKLAHSYTEYLGEDTPATCTTNRKDAYGCANCPADTIKEIENTKLAHSYTEYVAEDTPATCTTNRKDTYQCATCTATTVKEIENSKVAHSYTEYVAEDTPATCTTNRKDTYKCATCTATTVKEIENSKVAHSYTGYVCEDTPATCTTNRKDTYQCATCPATTVKEIENTKLAHSYTVYVSEYTPATCTTNRKDTYKCATCTATTVKEIAGTANHTSPLQKTEASDGTCLVKGNTEYYYCASCDKYFSDADGKIAITLADTETDYAAHALTHKDAVAVSCLTDGKKAYDECTVCDKLFIENQEVTADDVIIAAKGEHTWGEWNAENGTRTCTIEGCGAIDTCTHGDTAEGVACATCGYTVPKTTPEKTFLEKVIYIIKTTVKVFFVFLIPGGEYLVK